MGPDGIPTGSPNLALSLASARQDAGTDWSAGFSVQAPGLGHPFGPRRFPRPVCELRITALPEVPGGRWG